MLQTYERRTLDLRARAFADVRRADPRIVAVVIDQRSLDVIAAPRDRGGFDQGWPWPRDFHAAVVRYLRSAGARAIAFDLVFSEPSIYTRLGVADDDRALAEAAAGGAVVHTAVLTREGDARADRAWPSALGAGGRVQRLVAPSSSDFNKATLPVPPVAASARALGWIGFEPDDDGTCRAIRPVAAYAPLGARDAVEVPALAVALAAAGGARVETAPRLSVDGRRSPLDEEGRLLLRFHGGDSAYRQVSFAAVLDAARRAAVGQRVAPPADFRDAYVIVGASAAGLLDLRATSMSPVVPGYLIHATALDNVLHGDGLRRPAPPARAGIVLLLGALTGAVMTASGLRTASLAVAAVGLGYVAIALWAFAARAMWLDVVTPMLALALAYAGAVAHGYLTEGRARRFLRDAFSRYVAPEVVDQLVTDPGRLVLGGETREVTVMFADVAGFTSLSEGRPPAEVVGLMNECFTALTEVIQRHGGTVDKFIGDAVMAFWNAPIRYDDHAARACRAARDLLDALDGLNGVWSARGLPTISMRVGIATGPAVVGNVGSRTKFNYTVMGDTVNLASRLEGAAKVYGTLTLVAATTAERAAGAVAIRELDWLQVKGRAEAVTVFEIDRAPDADEARRRFAEGLRAYRLRRFAEAAEHFEIALKTMPDDGAAREMLSRCHAFAAAPPPADWNGAHALASK
ncbi:MAG: adenylate/guanylate cyclase domain-containing protein [Candidatus Rokubacteria bacterium]|nr:adenylate/guanylate cyclase domain-containing protein [Candidatus Rokubacteria bacterium]